METIQELYQWLSDNASELARDVLVSCLLIGLGVVVYLASWRDGYNWVRGKCGQYLYPLKLLRNWKRARDRQMGTKKALERFWTDVICNAGENAVHSGQFTRAEINQWYLMFGKKMTLTDLLPKQFVFTRRDAKTLKGAILNRIGPEAREAFKEKQKTSKKKLSAKAIKLQFKRAFRDTEAA